MKRAHLWFYECYDLVVSIRLLNWRQFRYCCLAQLFCLPLFFHFHPSTWQALPCLDGCCTRSCTSLQKPLAFVPYATKDCGGSRIFAKGVDAWPKWLSPRSVTT